MSDVGGSTVAERFVDVGGIRIRYLEAGDGPVVICLHGGAIGSSSEVFCLNLLALAQAGFRAIAFDQPGFGKSGPPRSEQLQTTLVVEFAEALGLGQAALIGHSRAGAKAVELALMSPSRYTHIVVLGTGSLLPALGEQSGEREAAEQQQQERDQALQAPDLQEIRRLLEADLYHHELITPALLELRHAYSGGANFAAFAARHASGVSNKKPKSPGQLPLRQRLGELAVPLLMVYGREDRAHAAERARLLHRQQPGLNIQIIENCKHLVPLDAADAVARLLVDFLSRQTMAPQPAQQQQAQP